MHARAMNLTGAGLGPLAAAALLSVAPVQAAPVTFNLCASAGTATLTAGVSVPIWGFSLDASPGAGGGCAPAQLPGPVLEVNVGDVVTVNLDNRLAENVAVVFLGQDMVPDTAGAAPGDSRSYTFTAGRPGTFLYESGIDSAKQLPMGLYGAFIVHPTTAGRAYDDASTAYDVDATLVLSEIDPALNADPAAFDLLSYHPVYWLINGKAYPDTATIEAAAGQRLLLRYVNAGSLHHTMSLLGAHQRILAKDGYPLAHPYSLVAETIVSGQTVDSLVVAPAASATTRTPLFSRQLYLTSGPLVAPTTVHPVGGMLAFLDLGAGSPPVAVNDAYTLARGGTLAVPAPGVLGNDSDPDNAPLTAALIGAPTHASAFTLNANGSFSYTHNNDAATSDSFSYVANDGTSASAVATVSLTITAAVPTLYFSTGTDSTVPGVVGPYDNADIYARITDGTFRRVFDASGAGSAGLPATANVDAFAVVATDAGGGVTDLYLSFANNPGVVLPNLDGVSGGATAARTVQDEDIVRGQKVGATWNWTTYFDGSDVGLGDGANNEDVDAFALLADGSLVISVRGTPALGVALTPVPRDVDLLRCLGTFGATTSCTWSLYFDGSDIGLDSATSEDLDGAAPAPSGDLYLSTLGAFTVTGLSGGGDDIFVCTAAATGPATSCATLTPFFDGSAAGLGNDLDAFDLP